MRTRVVDDVLRIHLDMQETEELESTGYVIATDMDDDSIRCCITYSVNDLNKEYEVFASFDMPSYSNWNLLLSYEPRQEEEDF